MTNKDFMKELTKLPSREEFCNLSIENVMKIAEGSVEFGEIHQAIVRGDIWISHEDLLPVSEVIFKLVLFLALFQQHYETEIAADSFCCMDTLEILAEVKDNMEIVLEKELTGLEFPLEALKEFCETDYQLAEMYC